MPPAITPRKTMKIHSVSQTHEIDTVAPGIFVWQRYDPAVKADLFSTALDTPSGGYLVDPIALGAKGFEEIRRRTRVIGVIATNANHARAAAEFTKAFSVPMLVHHTLVGVDEFSGATGVREDETISSCLKIITIDSGPAGEIALHCDQDGGILVVGDALINFGPYGFGFLPAKYCSNAKQMRRSLRKLLDYRFERLLFAHGMPILSGARDRLERLLDGG